MLRSFPPFHMSNPPKLLGLALDKQLAWVQGEPLDFNQDVYLASAPLCPVLPQPTTCMQPPTTLACSVRSFSGTAYYGLEGVGLGLRIINHLDLEYLKNCLLLQ